MKNLAASQPSQQDMLAINPLDEKFSARWIPIFRVDISAVISNFLLTERADAADKFFRQAESSLLQRILSYEVAKNYPVD